MPTDLLISDFTDARFQAAFRLYFAELGIRIQNWDGLWQEMNHDPNTVNHAYIRLDENGTVIGFIQFCSLTMKSWFFEEQLGFIRELWVSEAFRGMGHGKALLQLAEAYCKDHGIAKCILTTDTAPGFYEKLGYNHEPAIAARNKDAVWVKRL